MILGLIGNRTKEQVGVVLPAYVAWLEERGCEFLLSEDFGGVPGLRGRSFLPPETVVQRAGVVLSFGGDGTLLNSVRLLAGRETPVLGVNLGGLGYLTEVGSGELYMRTEQLLDGKWEIEKRMILEVTAANGPRRGPWHALNDVVIDKAGYARLIQLRTTIDGVFLNTFRSDGLIISTPTGSTGYSLSAGGPILEPKMAGILLSPLNPHSLANRPLLISDDKEILVEAHTPAEHTSVAVDGETVCHLKSGETLTIRRAPFHACLVNFAGRFFYDVLRQKLGWGDERLKV